MRILGTWNPADITPEKNDAALAALRAAYDSGYTLFDHADIYCQGECERVHGDLLRNSPELKRQTVIATKGGIRRANAPNPGDPGRYDFSRDYIISACLGSKQRLGVEQIDLYQLHRPDALMDVQEVAEAFAYLQGRGIVRWFGVSNFLPAQVTLLQKAWPELVVNQVEVSLKRLTCLEDGTLDQCQQLDITPLSWSPLGGGTVGQAHSLAETMGEPAVVALAWLLKHPSKIVPIVGSSNPTRIQAACGALTFEMSREDWYRLYVAARGEAMP